MSRGHKRITMSTICRRVCRVAPKVSDDSDVPLFWFRAELLQLSTRQNVFKRETKKLVETALALLAARPASAGETCEWRIYYRIMILDRMIWRLQSLAQAREHASTPNHMWTIYMFFFRSCYGITKCQTLSNINIANDLKWYEIAIEKFASV